MSDETIVLAADMLHDMVQEYNRMSEKYTGFDKGNSTSFIIDISTKLYTGLANTTSDDLYKAASKLDEAVGQMLMVSSACRYPL